MFLESISSSDERFRTLRFREGLNILVADRTESSNQGDSRNSVGKTSFVKIVRYIMGGDLPPEFRVPELEGHEFKAALMLPNLDNVEESVAVTRSVTPTTRLQVVGWSPTGQQTDLHIDEWRDLVTRYIFHVPEDVTRPTAGQLWGQFIRTFFGSPTKVHPVESDWESGVRIGFLLGLSPEILGQAAEVDRLNKQAKAIRKAVREGALSHLSLDEAALRAQLASARRQRDRTRENLRSFKVDEQYAAHQQRADRLSARIQQRNDEALSLERRARELTVAIADEATLQPTEDLAVRLARVYSEMGLVLPDAVGRRYEEVAAFHESVVRNRRLFLEQELDGVTSRLDLIAEERRRLDDERSLVMQLLNETVALNTFLTTQRDLAAQEAEVADLERRLETAASVAAIGDTIKLRTAELASSVRAEMADRQSILDDAISLFGELGSEIYTDREASLLVSPTPNGLLKVEPRISGDASTGVRGVEIFMFDTVCTVAAIKAGRAPRLLIHDSHLFDAIDGRQVASCLTIGARMAETYGYQYIVTLNSDFLESVENQSEGAFRSGPYIADVRLTDETEEGGLFGFRFG